MSNSINAFDKYTLVHFISGVCFPAFFSRRLETGLIVHTIFELVENSDMGIKFFISRDALDPEYKGDSFMNFIGDTLGFMSGMYLFLMFEKNKYI